MVLLLSYAVVNTKNGTGIGLFDLVHAVLVENALDISSCIGDATDGAANCHGEYNGLRAQLIDFTNGQHVYTWCYAHVLNLVVGDSTKTVLQAIIFLIFYKEPVRI